MTPADRTDANNGNTFFRQRRPLITYGKKDSRPLLLSANHFRLDPYSIPPDETSHEEQHGPPASTDARSGKSTQLEAAADNSAELQHLDPHGSLTRDVPCQHVQSAATLRSRSSTAASAAAPGADSTPLPTQPRQKERPRAPKRIKRVAEDKARQSTSETRRRLPVNELVLVPSPAGDANNAGPRSSPPGAQTEDPIGDGTSSFLTRDVSPIDSEDEGHEKQPARKQQPLSAIHKRLRTSKTRYKSITDLRKKRAKQPPSACNVSTKHGDGFAGDELFVSPLARKTVRRRRLKQDPLVSSFRASQLQSRPLPDVKFQHTSSPLTIQAAAASHDATEGMQASSRSKRQVSLSAQAREQAILAQLSSISAPPLPRPESDESEEVENEDGEEAGVDEEMIADGFQAVADDEIYQADIETEQDPHDAPEKGRKGNRINAAGVDLHEVETPAVGEDVSYDFRRLLPGQPPRRRRIRQDSLIEVHENIIDVPDSDDCFIPSFQPTIPQSQGSISVHQQEPDALQPPRSSLNSPRSILKNASQAVDYETTQVEHTASNTRRNSTVELSESRYFTDATDMLRRADPSKHQIIRRRRSSYFDEEVEMLDSGGIVTETSPSPEPEMLDTYSTTSNLSVLRRQSEVEWTSSQRLPTAPRDLGALTRSVSRGHGTLSQSARRRRSLPFQSPRKKE